MVACRNTFYDGALTIKNVLIWNCPEKAVLLIYGAQPKLKSGNRCVMLPPR